MCVCVCVCVYVYVNDINYLHIILYGQMNDALILVTSYIQIDFSHVHECILTALNCAVFILLMHVSLWLSLLLILYIVRNDENKDDQSIMSAVGRGVTAIDSAPLGI